MTVYVIRYRGLLFHQTSHRDDHHQMLNRLTRHGNNLSATTKACVDGMVDAGLIPDDSWKEVIGPDHRRGNNAPNAITFTITEEP